MFPNKRTPQSHDMSVWMNHLDPIQHELQSNILISEKKCVQIKSHKVISLMDHYWRNIQRVTLLSQQVSRSVSQSGIMGKGDLYLSTYIKYDSKKMSEKGWEKLWDLLELYRPILLIPE